MPEPSETPRIIGYTRASDEGGFAERPIYAEPNPTPAPGAATPTDEAAEGQGWPIGWCSSCDRLTSRGCVIHGRPACDKCGDWLIFSGVQMPAQEADDETCDVCGAVLEFPNENDPMYADDTAITSKCRHVIKTKELVAPGAGEMMESEMELKPCPFCGNKVEFRESHVLGEGGRIRHLDMQEDFCYADFAAISATENESVIAAWNRRAVIDSIPTPAAPQEKAGDFEEWWDGYLSNRTIDPFPDPAQKINAKQAAWSAWHARPVPKESAPEPEFRHDEDCPCYAEQHSIDCANCDCQCRRPPKGWRCTREPGHSGPCAAVLVEEGESPTPDVAMRENTPSDVELPEFKLIEQDTLNAQRATASYAKYPSYQALLRHYRSALANQGLSAGQREKLEEIAQSLHKAYATRTWGAVMKAPSAIRAVLDATGGKENA